MGVSAVEPPLINENTRVLTTYMKKCPKVFRGDAAYFSGVLCSLLVLVLQRGGIVYLVDGEDDYPSGSNHLRIFHLFCRYFIGFEAHILQLFCSNIFIRRYFI